MAKQTAFIGKCKKCGRVQREVGMLETRTSKGDYGRTIHSFKLVLENGKIETMRDRAQYARSCHCGELTPTTCSGRHVTMELIVAHTTLTPCDARCTGATGHQCECSCGGKNHGIHA